MTKVLILLGLLFVLLLGVLVVQNSLKSGGSLFTVTPTATIDDYKFNLKVARTSKEKEIGLSEEKNLGQNNGMLFTFEQEGYYTFWMKNMKFPIDIIYIRDGIIVTIYENVQPPKDNANLPVYQPKSPADTVLEINAGLSSKYNFKEGDSVKLENIK